MQAAVLTDHGGPERLEVRDGVAAPVAGPGEVLVRVAASSVNNTDIWSREGAYGTATEPDAVAGWRGERLRFPRVQGGDVAGTVVAGGEGVESLVGSRVLVDCALYGGEDPDATPVGLLGSERDGGFAQLVAVDARRVHDMAASPLSDAELACLPVAYGTAMGMVDRGGVGAGDRVLVTGASGGVGLAAVQLAAALGARVTAVSTAGKADQVGAAGAHHVIDRTGARPVATRVAEGGPVDVVLDVVGGPGFTDLPGLLAPHGSIVVAGAIAGPVVAVDLRQLYLDQRRIVGSTMHTPAQFSKLAGLARSGAIRPRVAGSYPLAELHRAQSDFLAKGFVGKLVVVPEQ